MFTSNRNEAEFIKQTVLKNLYNYASKEQFQLVSQTDMHGLIILLLAKRGIQIRLFDVSTSNIRAGGKDKSGMKGAVMILFQLEDTTFVFVNNHL